MKLWVDDVRPAPDDSYFWVMTTNAAKAEVRTSEIMGRYYELVDLDHDAGRFARDGGDYINILNWLEETNRNYPIHIHSMNPVGVENMRRIIKKNGWTEIK